MGDLSLLRRLGGHPVLDFVNTVDPRHAEPRTEYLRDCDALLAWSTDTFLDDHRTRLLTANEADAARQRPLIAKEQEWRRAIELREALWTCFGRPNTVGATDLATVQSAVRAALGGGALEPTGLGFIWVGGRPGLSLAVDRLAISAIELMTSSRFERVRECPGEGCGWLFLDTSRAGRRRWCSMRGCGNLAKVHRYRAAEKRTSEGRVTEAITPARPI